MNESIFRKKNIERISSPEMLDDYVKVVSLPVWIILTGILIVCIGFVTWSAVGKVDTLISTAAYVNNGDITCYLSDENIGTITTGNEVLIDGLSCVIKKISEMPVKAESVDEYVLYRASLMQQPYVYEIKCTGNIPDGIYDAKIIIEKKSLFSYAID